LIREALRLIQAAVVFYSHFPPLGAESRVMRLFAVNEGKISSLFETRRGIWYSDATGR